MLIDVNTLGIISDWMYLINISSIPPQLKGVPSLLIHAALHSDSFFSCELFGQSTSKERQFESFQKFVSVVDT